MTVLFSSTSKYYPPAAAAEFNQTQNLRRGTSGGQTSPAHVSRNRCPCQTDTWFYPPPSFSSRNVSLEGHVTVTGGDDKKTMPVWLRGATPFLKSATWVRPSSLPCQNGKGIFGNPTENRPTVSLSSLCFSFFPLSSSLFCFSLDFHFFFSANFLGVFSVRNLGHLSTRPS